MLYHSSPLSFVFHHLFGFHVVPIFGIYSYFRCHLLLLQIRCSPTSDKVAFVHGTDGYNKTNAFTR